MMMQGVRMIGCLSVIMKERECQCKGENEKKKVLKIVGVKIIDNSTIV